MNAPDSPAAGPDRNGQWARLRDRTDEIELIISGLTTFALFALPSWMFERLALHYTHLSEALAVGGMTAVVLMTGLCYALASCFLVHLLTRAYWIGLIGLRTAFPEGIQWQRTPGIGPLTRDHYRAHLPDLKTAIRRADRLASSLFAVISLIALSVLWIGTLMLLTVVVSVTIGAQFGATNRAINFGVFGLVGLMAGLPGLLWLLDAQLGARVAWIRNNRAFRALIAAMVRMTGWLLPQRIILPVQLTLQSNTRPLVFVLALFLAVGLIVFIGNLRLIGWTSFTLSGEFHYLESSELATGLRSSHYEDQRTDKDRLRAWPMITSFEQRGGFVRLFLPYQPLRDNLILDQLCVEPERPSGATCLRRLWSVSLNGRPVSMAEFLPTERMDLRMLGLTGLVPLEDFVPGLQQLRIVWNPDASDQGAMPDDRYERDQYEYAIPFLFSPDFERDLEPPAGARAEAPSAESETSDPGDDGG